MNETQHEGEIGPLIPFWSESTFSAETRSEFQWFLTKISHFYLQKPKINTNSGNKQGGKLVFIHRPQQQKHL